MIRELLRPQDIERFYSKLLIDDGCWLWQGTLRSRELPYGAFKARGEMLAAHRLSYELLVGKIPPDMVLDHLCRVVQCVNPRHLQVVTSKENTRRSIPYSTRHHRNKTHCPAGHPYTDSNLYVRPDGHGRGCRTCKQMVRAAFKARTGR